jgi:tubulin monoglycylase TTLL3/8
LCNYSIQKNYKNSTERHAELPEENMWTNQEFIDKYLARIGKKNAWEDSIYPAFKNSILCAMLSIQDLVENRKNSFELYGADFMITEDLKPWLIEINCSPTMARSTEITTMLCDNVLDDICKGK